jgi:ankyrin repeat protein
MQAIEMNELHGYAKAGNLERVKQMVDGGADIDEPDRRGKTALLHASYAGELMTVIYLVDHGANIAHADSAGMTALHFASINGRLSTVEYLLKHGARITERSDEGMTALLLATEDDGLEVIQYLLSSEGGGSISETNNEGCTALLIAAHGPCVPSIVQWLLEFGDAQITDIDTFGESVWISDRPTALSDMLRGVYTKSDDGDYVFIDGEHVFNGDIEALTAMLCVMVLHGGPPESLAKDLAPPFQRIVQDGARLRARLPGYLTQRWTLLDAHCPLLPPLQDLVHGYEVPTTTDELWATGLAIGASL